jgi:iron complex transport system ATP-binding protein
MIARALVHQPKALLFDEPSNSLDVVAQIELRRTMSKLAQSGIALLLITHHLPDVVPEIERVIFMRDGRIVGDGSKPELLTADRLGSLFGCPVHVTTQDGYYHLVS